MNLIERLDSFMSEFDHFDELEEAYFDARENLRLKANENLMYIREYTTFYHEEKHFGLEMMEIWLCRLQDKDYQVEDGYAVGEVAGIKVKTLLSTTG